MNRREAREVAFFVLFAYDFNRDESLSLVWERAQTEQGYEYDKYVNELLSVLMLHLEEIDSAIKQYAIGWKFDRISIVSKTVLRIATAEMFYLPQIPLNVSLNEAIELSKRFDDEKAYGFVNGVLNTIKNDIRAVEKK